MIDTGLPHHVMSWSHSGEVLAVAAKERDVPMPKDRAFKFVNRLKLYNEQGQRIFSTIIPSDIVSVETKRS